jgi:glutathione S-transferase
MAETAAPTLRLVTFHPAWGLPTSGPFGLKLEACLRMLDVPYERAFEADNRKGPKRKSPWIEDGNLRVGDTEMILEHIRRTRGKELDRDLSPVERARGHVLRRMLEEHYHQVFEYELMVLDDGFAEVRKQIDAQAPALLRPIVAPLVRRAFKRHLFERGIARHSAHEVEAMGRADVDALAAWLGGREWFIADGPTKADATAFGLLAVSIRSALPTPVCTYARSMDNLVAFVARGLARWFPEHPAALPSTTGARSGRLTS